MSRQLCCRVCACVWWGRVALQQLIKRASGVIFRSFCQWTEAYKEVKMWRMNRVHSWGFTCAMCYSPTLGAHQLHRRPLSYRRPQQQAERVLLFHLWVPGMYEQVHGKTAKEVLSEQITKLRRLWLTNMLRVVTCKSQTQKPCMLCIIYYYIITVW